MTEKRVVSFDEFIASAGKVEYDLVSLDDGTAVRIASLTPTDMEEWNTLRETPEGKKVSGPVLILKSQVDDKGTRIGVTSAYKDMTDAEKGRVAALQTINLKVSEKILLAIFKLNGIGKTELVDAKNG